MRFSLSWRRALVGAVALGSVLSVACGSAATPTTAPTAVPTTAPSGPTSTLAPTAVPTAAPTVTSLPTGVTSARNDITLVVANEPVHMSAMETGGGTEAVIVRDNLADTLTWQSGDDLRIVPTSATTGWEQIDADTWRFTLRQGVTFQDGEPWNAQAALPSLEYQGSATGSSNSISYTGAYTAEVVDDYTLDINCAQACPIFPNTAFYVEFESPKFLTESTQDEILLKTVGFGPYRTREWNHGVNIQLEAYEGYVPAGDHFEFQKPLIQNVTFQWRNEPTVMAAMVSAGEADLAWDVGVDAKETVNTKSGGSAEMLAFTLNTLWHPELKKDKVRQAVSHAIDCEEIVASLYHDQTRCRGNIIFPGVIGATEENTAPYGYDPALAQRLLDEAGYNPDNKITIMGRSARIPKLTEVYEAMHAYLTAVGMNVEVSVVEASVRNAHRVCASGQAVRDAMTANGKDPSKDKPTREDFQLAVEKGPTSGCTPAHFLENEPSNETLDYGRQANYYMNCAYVASLFCDPSEGGIQDQLSETLALSGEARELKMRELADLMHENVYLLGMFEIPVVYAIDPKLNWEPRFDRRVRVSSMWFSP